KSYVLALVCGLTKYVYLKAVPDITTETSVEFLLEVCFHHGCSQNFTSMVFESALKLLNETHRITTSFRPVGNAQVERGNALISQILSMYVNDNQDNWSEFVGYCMLLINSSQNQTTAMSPFELLYGYKPRLPFDTIFSPEVADIKRSQQLKNLMKMRELAKSRIEIVQKKMKDRINPIRKQHDFKVGDLVRVKSDLRKVGLSQKLRKMWLGVYRIVSATKKENVFKVKLMSKGPRGNTK